MENFIWDIPTKLHFGKDVCLKMKEILPSFGKKILLIRGGDSLIKNGVRNKILAEIIAAGMEYKEFSGIKPNPRINEVRAAYKLTRDYKPDVIVALGGGSVIDSAKALAASALYNNDPWDLYTGQLIPEKAIPLITVLTVAATGTEMNSYSVLQNEETNIKTAFANKLVTPVYSFLDPSFTISVPRKNTAYGISDIVAHCMEAYFGRGDASLADRFSISIIKEIIKYGPKLLKETDNYNLRAKIMYAATCALNDITSYGRKSGDWGVHALGHVFSLLYDIPHGATLSAVYPAWLRLMENRIPERITEFGKAVFALNDTNETILAIEQMYASFLSPLNIRELKISQYSRIEVLQNMEKSKVSGYIHKLNYTDYECLLDFMEK